MALSRYATDWISGRWRGPASIYAASEPSPIEGVDQSSNSQVAAEEGSPIGRQPKPFLTLGESDTGDLDLQLDALRIECGHVASRALADLHASPCRRGEPLEQNQTFLQQRSQRLRRLGCRVSFLHFARDLEGFGDRVRGNLSQAVVGGVRSPRNLERAHDVLRERRFDLRLARPPAEHHVEHGVGESWRPTDWSTITQLVLIGDARSEGLATGRPATNDPPTPRGQTRFLGSIVPEAAAYLTPGRRVTQKMTGPRS